MCGITGFVGAEDRRSLYAMTAALAHRGPDGEGFHVDCSTGVHLGHRRLAILDITGGDQPMWNEDGQVGVIFNGEIYNHEVLRGQLEEKGHVFHSSHSDTEVLVHGYEEWGSDLPLRLNGMFAFAIYDKIRRRIFLARDRFGEKPLYYCSKGEFFAFASELSALAHHPAVDRSLSLTSLQKFFAYGYLPAPNSFYGSSQKLPAGHSLTLDIKTGGCVMTPYWRFRIEPDEDLGSCSEGELVEQLRALLSQAVGRRLISDVPLGIFLSGGLDSSTVLASACQSKQPSDLMTFTIGFTEPSFDESGYADAVAGAFGACHRQKVLDLDSAKDLIPVVLGRLDEPLGDPSILPTYLLSAFTRDHVTVALSGDGGDELFAGYDPFKALHPARVYERLIPKVLHNQIRCLADLLPVSTRNMAIDFKIKRSLMGLSYPREIWNPVWMSPVEPRDMAELFQTPLRAEDLYAEAITQWQSSSGDLVDRTLEYFTNLYLVDDILTKMDRTSMMVSLESRAVFLDNDLVEFCRRLPNRFKYRNGERKYLLKKAMQGLLPNEILARRKKGFGIPLAKWLRSSFQDWPETSIPGINSQWVKRRQQSHRAGKADHRLLLWCWMSLQRRIAAQQPVTALREVV
jgi:asparagine synthase (glutamine-hydrolysing)